MPYNCIQDNRIQERIQDADWLIVHPSTSLSEHPLTIVFSAPSFLFHSPLVFNSLYLSPNKNVCLFWRVRL